MKKTMITGIMKEESTFKLTRKEIDDINDTFLVAKMCLRKMRYEKASPLKLMPFVTQFF